MKGGGSNQNCSRLPGFFKSACLGFENEAFDLGCKHLNCEKENIDFQNANIYFRK